MAKFVLAESPEGRLLRVRFELQDDVVNVLVNDVYVVSIREGGIRRPFCADDSGLPVDERGRVLLTGEEI